MLTPASFQSGLGWAWDNGGQVHFNPVKDIFMSIDNASSKLADQRYHSLVVRLLVNPQGKLQHGVVVDLNSQTIGQFQQWDEFIFIVHRWLKTMIQK